MFDEEEHFAYAVARRSRPKYKRKAVTHLTNEVEAERVCGSVRIGRHGMDTTRNTELDVFIAAYTPEIATLTHALFDRLRARIPGATILVYNYYNALAIGWAPDDQTAHGVLSLALYPRWVNLCLLHGIDLPDPHKVLTGAGNQVRTIRLTDAAMLDDLRIEAVIDEALTRSKPPIDPNAAEQIIIKGTSPKQRSRRP